MTKTEREELRRLLRQRFKVLRADVAARKAELVAELETQIEEQFADVDRRYDDCMYQLQLAVDEANRKANDIGRELWGLEKWGSRHDKTIVNAAEIPRPGVHERQMTRHRGAQAIDARVKNALLELDRQENELLTTLATTAIESAEARAFLAQIPNITELVPSYRLAAITDMPKP